MSCHGIERYLFAASYVLVSILLGVALPARGGTIVVNDSWADGGRNTGADPIDTDWWTSTSNQAIEVSAGSMGLVTGSSGRGIHGIYTPVQLVNPGDYVKATFTFTTPSTVVASPG